MSNSVNISYSVSFYKENSSILTPLFWQHFVIAIILAHTQMCCQHWGLKSLGSGLCLMQSCLHCCRCSFDAKHSQRLCSASKTHKPWSLYVWYCYVTAFRSCRKMSWLLAEMDWRWKRLQLLCQARQQKLTLHYLKTAHTVQVRKLVKCKLEF